jgi:hypothetical protein
MARRANNPPANIPVNPPVAGQQAGQAGPPAGLQGAQAPGAGVPQQQPVQQVQQVQQQQQGAQQPPPVVDPFDACLQRLSLSPGAIQHMHDQGFEHEEDLMNMTSFEGMSNMLDQITKRGVIPPNVRFPYVAMTGLKAFRAWLLYRETRGESTDPTYFDQAQITIWRTRISRLENIVLEAPASVTKPPFLANTNDWLVWEQLFNTYLFQCRSHRCGVPLAYVIRRDSAVDPAALTADYADLDFELIATATHEGPDFELDNHRVYDKLKPLVLKEGPNTGLYNFIQAYDATRNGRAAYLALKAQSEGPAAIRMRTTSAYHQTTNARFANLTRKFTFDQYVAIFQTAFNDLEMYGEPVAPNKKVTDFLAGITCPELQTIKTIVKSNPDLVGNFEACQQFVKQQVNELLVNVPVTRNVSFARTNNNNNNNNNNNRGNNARGRTPTNQSNNDNRGGEKRKGRGGKASAARRAERMGNYRHYTPEQWAQLSQSERNRIVQEREAYKQRQAAAATTTTTPAPAPAVAAPVPPRNAPYPPRNRQVSSATTQLSGGGPGPSWLRQQNGVVNVSAARSTVVNVPTPPSVAVAPTAPTPVAAAPAATNNSSSDDDAELSRVRFSYEQDVKAYNAAYARYKEAQKREGIYFNKNPPLPPISVEERMMSKHQRKKFRAQREEDKPDPDRSGYGSDSDYPSEYDSENDFFRNEDEVNDAEGDFFLDLKPRKERYLKLRQDNIDGKKKKPADVPAAPSDDQDEYIDVDDLDCHYPEEK